jgi:hypothetical protein
MPAPNEFESILFTSSDHGASGLQDQRFSRTVGEPLEGSIVHSIKLEPFLDTGTGQPASWFMILLSDGSFIAINPANVVQAYCLPTVAQLQVP